jgi:hypothetical protein
MTIPIALKTARGLSAGRVRDAAGLRSPDGTAPTQVCKRRAEDCANGASGVTHVQNNLRAGPGDGIIAAVTTA